jgi:rSAM/selenodomain-associated transferase 1
MADKRHMRAQRCLIIMVKEPRLGAVKTRLARDIGPVQATRFYRTVTANLLRRLAADSRWRTVLAVSPDHAPPVPCLPAHVPRTSQGEGDLGVRMARLLRTQFPAHAILIGSDIPGIRAQHIAEAFGVLKRHNAVFGPTGDGGFWLVGLKPLPRLEGAFRGVRWSSPFALSDTLANLERREVGFAANLLDVDDGYSYTNVGQMGECTTLPSGFLRSRDHELR